MKILPRYVEVVDGVVMNSLQTSGTPPTDPIYRCNCEPELGHTWHPDNIPTTEATETEPERELTLEEWKTLHTGKGHSITTHRIVAIGRRTDIQFGWTFDPVTGVFSSPPETQDS